MKYLLILTFEYKKYKAPIEIKIFSGDTLIDVLELTESIQAKETPYETQINFLKKHSNWIIGDNWDGKNIPLQIKKHAQVPEKIFVYEIDDKIIKDKIRLVIDDNNTNYTNGFMSKSNLIMMRDCVLVPKHLLSHSTIDRLSKMYSSHHARYSKKTKHIFLPKEDDGYIPNIERQIFWPATKEYSVNDKLTSEQWVGGNAEISIPVIKKFRIYMLWAGAHLRNRFRPIFKGSVRFLYLEHIFNLINTINEDQRSNITKN